MFPKEINKYWGSDTEYTIVISWAAMIPYKVSTGIALSSINKASFEQDHIAGVIGIGLFRVP